MPLLLQVLEEDAGNAPTLCDALECLASLVSSPTSSQQQRDPVQSGKSSVVRYLLSMRSLP